MTQIFLSTTDVCRALGLTESTLRHVLRQPRAPRPARHPTAGVFLWTELDIESLAVFLAERRRPRRRGGSVTERAG